MRRRKKAACVDSHSDSRLPKRQAAGPSDEGSHESIPEEYTLRAPLPGQRPYNLGYAELSILVDALEVGMCFPLHPTIEECLRLAGAPTNNKGWKAQYFFISGPSWGFKVDWSVHPISNILPCLSEEESTLANRLKKIFSLSQAIGDMTELWLVEAGLSPAFQGAMDLSSLCGMPKMFAGKSTPTARTGYHYQMALLDRVHDVGRLVTIMGHRATGLREEIENLKYGCDPEQVAMAKQQSNEVERQAAGLKVDNKKLMAQLVEATKRLELSKKELTDVRVDLAVAQRDLKEQRPDHRKSNDDLLKTMKENEMLKAELPKKSIEDYMEFIKF
ncbi:hypothetical protein B296_00000578 [Ensete ventricosum]|uniref:Uncharacterized protein n=1 Tax=Ensete ventricosum TaxID=4639 RepID=A0A427AYW1_ENSVE|nr:hypothetical protein B296_00000578 [Ensete ventricosum]